MFDADLSRIIQQIVLVVPGFLIGITVHEYAHGYVAFRLGDPTAKYAGRLTFNPISHIDPIGALVLILTQMIGWAKPVPVDPRFFRNPRTDMMMVSLAGPAANIIAAVSVAVILHALVFVLGGKSLGEAGFFFLWPLIYILRFTVMVNVMLAIFNLVPIPPLDGSKILAGMLPGDMAYQFEKLEPYGFIVLVLLLFSGAISFLIYPPIKFVTGVLLSGLG